MTDLPHELEWAEFPETATSAGQNYWLQSGELTVLGTHIISLHGEMRALLHHVSRTPKEIRNAINISDPTEREAAQESLRAAPLAEVILPGYQSLLTQLDRLEPRTNQLLAELFVSRLADNFLTYLSDIIALLFRNRPETLRASEQVTVEQVLAHRDLDSFIAWYADRRVSALSFKGLDSVAEFLRSRFGLELFTDNDVRERVSKFVAMRNLLVHGRGVVDRRFVDLVGTEFGEVGMKVHAGHFVQDRTIDDVAQVVRELDSAAAEKFGLQLHPNPQPDLEFLPRPDRS